MAEPPDLEELAKRYVALWQDQLVAAADDPILAHQIARVLTGWAALAGMAWRPPAGAAHDRSRPDRSRPASREEAAPAGAAPRPAARPSPAAAPPDERGELVAQLQGRIATLEERIAQLEAGARRAGARGRGTPRRRRP